MRGDREIQSSIDAFSYSFFIELTEEETVLMMEKAQKRYDLLERSRVALGLDPFDNNVPDVLASYYDDTVVLT